MKELDNSNIVGGKIEQLPSGKFKADKTIITSVGSARSIHERLRAGNIKRVRLYSEIDGLVQGNPPYDSKALQQAGLGHIANYNNMFARAEIKRACLAYWNLLHNAQSMIKIELDIPDPNAPEWARTMSYLWDKVVKRLWPSFLINIASLSTQIVKFGISPTLWRDERDPRWTVVELNKFFIPDQTQSDIEMLTTVCVESDFTIQYLWNVYNEYKNTPANDTPWNVKTLGQLLCTAVATPLREANQQLDLMDLERKLYSGDLSFDRLYNDSIRVVSLFQKEYNNKISHYMFHRNIVAPNTEDDTGFLFFQQDQYESISDAFVIFTKDPGEFTIHANRGLGHEIFSLAQAKIQLDCSVVDMAKWASTPIIKSGAGNTKDVEQIRFYPGVPTNIGTADFVQNNLGANVNNVVGAAQYLSSLIQFNSTYSGTDPANPDPDKGSLSPVQTKMLAYKEFNVLKNNIMHFYTTFDRVIQNMTKKMLEAKEGNPGAELGLTWKKRCLEAGIPPEVFKKANQERIEVFATRVAGAGSQVAQLIGLQELQSIMGSFGPREERAYKRSLITAAVGVESLEEFDQDSNTVDEQAGGASLAGVENAVIQAGKSPIFSKDNDQRAHSAVHMALATQTIQALQQQQSDPIEADKIFSVLVPHLSEHISALQQSPFAQSEFNKLKPGFDQVVKYATLNRANAAKMMQAQAKQQQQQEQQLSESQVKTQITQADEQRKDFKLQKQDQRQEDQHQTKKRMLEEKTMSDIEMKRLKTVTEAELAKQKAGADIAAKQVSQGYEGNSASQDLRELNGSTPAPYDIEGIVKTNRTGANK